MRRRICNLSLHVHLLVLFGTWLAHSRVSYLSVLILIRCDGTAPNFFRLFQQIIIGPEIAFTNGRARLRERYVPDLQSVSDSQTANYHGTVEPEAT